MSKFIKKPLIIEAVQFTGDNFFEIARFVGRGSDVLDNPELKSTDHPVIHTLEGDMEASPGDWVIKGVKGEFYPCKPDIFAATYDTAPDATDATDDLCDDCYGSGLENNQPDTYCQTCEGSGYKRACRFCGNGPSAHVGGYCNAPPQPGFGTQPQIMEQRPIPEPGDIVRFHESFRPLEGWKLWRVTVRRKSAQNASWIGIDAERLDGSESLADYDSSKFVVVMREQKPDLYQAQKFA